MKWTWSVLLVGACVLGSVSTTARADGVLDQLARTVNPHIAEREAELDRLRARLEELPPLSVGRHGEQLGYHSPWLESEDQILDIVVDLGRVRHVDAVVLAPVSTVFQGIEHPSYGFPRRFAIDLAVRAVFDDVRTVFDAKNEDVRAPNHYPFVVEVGGVQARYVRLRVTRQWRRPDGRCLTALGELMVLAGARNVAVGAAVDAESGVSLPVWAPQYLVDGQTNLGLPISREPSRTNGFRSDSSDTPGVRKWVQIDLGREVEVDEIRLIPAHPFDAPNRYGHGFPVRFRLLASGDGDWSRATVVADHTVRRFPNPGDNPVVFPVERQAIQYVRLEADELWHTSEGRFALALAEMQVYSGDENVAFGAAVDASDILPAKHLLDVWYPDYLVDGFSSQNELIELDDWLELLDQRRRAEAAIVATEASLRNSLDRTTAWIVAVTLAGAALIVLLVGLNHLRRRRQVAVATQSLRDQISRDLHDDLGSRIGGIRLLSEMALDDIELPGHLRGDLQEIHLASQSAVAAMRDIVWLTDGRAATIEDVAKHLRQIAEEVLGSIEWSWKVGGDLPRKQIGFDRRRQLALAFREVLWNVVRHAHASRVEIELDAGGDVLRLRVCDNGVGFDPDAATQGRGLANLGRRVKLLGGEFYIHSTPHGGTSLALEIPIGKSPRI